MLVIAIATGLAIAAWLFQTINSKPQKTVQGKKPTGGPDMPVSFGYKCSWFAVKTTDAKGVGAMLSFKRVWPMNWQNGVDEAYNYIDSAKLISALSSRNPQKGIDKATSSKIFLTPPVDGWTLAIVGKLPLEKHGDEEHLKAVKDVLAKLSAEFGEAQYFTSHRVSSVYGWMQAVKGTLTRVYHYADGDLTCEGEPNGLEKELNLVTPWQLDPESDTDLDEESIIIPDEELVLKIAGSWSVNPGTLADRKDIQPAMGLFGTYP